MNLCSRLVAIPMLCTLAIGGCASTADIKSDKPIATYESKKSARDFSGCVADGWDNAYGAAVNSINSRHTQTGYVVSITERVFGMNNAVWLLESEDVQGGSYSKLYRGYALGGSKVIGIVDNCK